MLLLLIALCVPVLSGALAEGEETPLIVPIDQGTPVFGQDGAQIGTLRQDDAQGMVFTLLSGEEFAGVQVIFDQASANKAAKSDLLAGKTLVLLNPANAAEATDATPDPAAAVMPSQGWIDANLVVTALAARHATDTSAIQSRENQITSLTESLNTAMSANGESTAVPEKASGIFSEEKMNIWVPAAAIALGILGLGVLVWIAVSASTSAWVSERTVRQLTKLNDRLTDGLPLKTPLRIEQTAWPREGHVRLAPDVVEQLAAATAQNSALLERANTPVKEPEPLPPPPIPEGEEPDLLELANRLAGIASAAEWHAMVKEAGLKAVLLQANPTEKGTFIADDSGYSIIACLMRTPDAQLGYVLPSYQDPNASERRWMEFYSVNENNSVRNYRVDRLAVVHIERGTFFLPKSNGRLTRRQQQF